MTVQTFLPEFTKPSPSERLGIMDPHAICWNGWSTGRLFDRLMGVPLSMDDHPGAMLHG
jgi:hypothetical protein